MLRTNRNRSSVLALALAAVLLAGPAMAAGGADEAPAPAEKQPASFHLKATPDQVWTKPGGHETLKLRAEARQETALTVLPHEEVKGIHVRMSANVLKAMPGREAALLEVGLSVAPDAPRGTHVLRFVATSESGERREARVVVHVGGEGMHEPPAKAKPKPSTYEHRAGFAITLEPEALRARGGETVTFTLLARAARNATFDLGLDHLPEGYDARIEPATMTLGPGEHARARLTVVVPEGAHSGTLVVLAKAREGEGQAMAKARVEIVPQRPMPPVSTGNGTADEREPDGERDDADRYPPARPARPPQGGERGGFRMQIYPQDAVVGPEGGRALVLLQGGALDQVVALKASAEDASGWRVHVKGSVKLPAHGTAWAWVILQPGEDKAPLKYDLYGMSPLGRQVAHGSAHVEA